MLQLRRWSVGLGVGAALAGVLLVAGDAEARRARRHRGRHRFHSRAALTRPKSPATNDTGGAAEGGSPVASGPLQGEFRQDVVDGGALLVMEPGRALQLSSYRGLSLIDTSDPAAPKVLASLAVTGTGERMLLGDGEVAVLSNVWSENGTSTVVTSISIGSSSLAVAGSATITGNLQDAARQGAEILLVTTDGYFGPVPYADAVSGASPGGVDRSQKANAAGVAPDGSSVYDFYGIAARSHVARIRIGGDGTPTVLGAIELDGSVLGHAIGATEGVFAVQPCVPGWYGNDIPDPSGDPYEYVAPAIALVHVTSDATGAPQQAGSLDLADVTGVAAVDRDDATVRVLEWTWSGEVLATFDVSGAKPAALGTLTLSDWPSAFAFSGGAFAYATTNWNYGTQFPEKPALDPSGVENAMRATPGTTGQVVDGPTSNLHVVDLRDPTKIVLGGTLDLGAGWPSALVPVAGGVVTALYGYDDSNGGSTSVVRVDLTDPQTPSLSGSVAIGAYANLGTLLGDLLLVNAGTLDANGAFTPSTQLVDLTDGSLALGGSFGVASWTSAAARAGDLLGVASYDRLTLVDVSNVASPTVTGEARLLVNAAGFAALDAATGAVLTTDYVGGSVEIRTVALPAADPLASLGVVTLGTGDAQMFAAAPFLYVVRTDWSSGRATVQVVDASDAAHPRLRGSLDLAGYPEQVFLKDGALLLLRSVWSFFETNDEGGLTRVSDAFGNCPRSWLKDELGSVLDVVDLANPDAPAAANRLRLRWDSSGPAILSGDTLFVPSYVDVTSEDDDYQDYAYVIREIGVANPLAPVVGAPIDVPGWLVAATATDHQVLTSEYTWDAETGNVTSKLNLVDLSLPWRRRVVATRELAGYPETVTVSGGHAYVTTENWGNAFALGAGNPIATPVASLVSLDASDLSVTSTTPRERGAYQGEVAGGCLFLRGWGWTGVLDVYSLADSASPAFLASQDVAGISGAISVAGNRAYVAAGLYGVLSLDLGK